MKDHAQTLSKMVQMVSSMRMYRDTFGDDHPQHIEYWTKIGDMYNTLPKPFQDSFDCEVSDNNREIYD